MLKYLIFLTQSLIMAFPLLYSDLAKSDSEAISVLGWQAYMAPEVIASFEKSTGIHVNYYEALTQNNFIDELIDHLNQYDLLIAPGRWINGMAERQMIIPLDISRLPKWKTIRSDILTKYQTQDDIPFNGTPYFWGTAGIGINTTKIREAGIDPALNSWALLFNKEQRDKAKQCGIAVTDDRDALFGAALAYIGSSVNATEDMRLLEAGRLLKESLQDVKYILNNRYVDDLISGQICVAVGYSGELMLASAASPEIEFRIPDEGAIMWIDAMVISSQAPNPNGAYDLIRYLMQDKVSAKNANKIAYSSAMSGATHYLNPKLKKNPVISPDEAVVNRMEALTARPRKSMHEVQRMWVEALCARKGWCSVPLDTIF